VEVSAHKVRLDRELDRGSVIRPVGAMLVEINDEMIPAERRYIAAASLADLTATTSN
jgi:hypothetical protein